MLSVSCFLSLSLFVFLPFLAVCSLLLYLVLPLVSSVPPRVEPLRLALPKLSRSRFKIIQLTSNLHPRASSPSSLPQRRSSSSVLRRTRYLPLATLYTRIHTHTLSLSHTLTHSLCLSRAPFRTHETQTVAAIRNRDAAQKRSRFKRRGPPPPHSPPPMEREKNPKKGGRVMEYCYKSNEIKELRKIAGRLVQF